MANEVVFSQDIHQQFERPIMTQHTRIIAEAEINHNGDVEIAKRLVDAADACGADYVKFQCFTADAFIAPGSGFLPIFKERELKLGDFLAIRDHTAGKRVAMISTASDLTGLAMIVDLDLPLVKIGSTNIDNMPLLEAISETGKPVILSTGASTLGEIERAVCVLSRGTDDITLLHCTVQYPADDMYLNLRALGTMTAVFPGRAIGYSDHSVGTVAGPLAVALGATWLEKHFTLDNTMEGPDHHFSADPETMTDYIAAVRRTEAMLGSAAKEPVGPELEIRVAGRRYLTAMVGIKAGGVIDGNNVMPRRIDASKVDPVDLLGSDQARRVAGWRAVSDLEAGVAITFADIEPAR